MTKKERIILILLAALNFTHTLDFMVMMPLNIYLGDSLGVNAFRFSVLVGAYSISAFISGLTIALFIDRFDRKKTLMVAYIGFLLGTVACGFAESYLMLLMGRIVAGLFGGIIGAQILAIVADMFSYERRGRAVGAVMAGFAVASVIGVPFSQYLVNSLHDNWHAPFILIGGIGLVLLPMVYRWIPSLTDHISDQPGKANQSPFSIFSTVWKVREQRNALLFSGILMVGHFLIIPFISPYLVYNKGYSPEQIPVLFLVGGAASLMSAFLLGRLADKYGKLNVFSLSAFLSIFFTVWATQLPDGLPFGIILLIFFPMFMVVTGRLLTAQSIVTEVVSSNKRGSFMSINGSIRELGSGIAAIGAGTIVHSDKLGKIHHYPWVGYLSALILGATILVARSIFGKIDAHKKQKSDILQETM